jgi:hypothetical protein
MEEINTPETADGTRTKVKIEGLRCEKKRSQTKMRRQEPKQQSRDTVMRKTKTRSHVSRQEKLHVNDDNRTRASTQSTYKNEHDAKRTASNNRQQKNQLRVTHQSISRRCAAERKG